MTTLSRLPLSWMLIGPFVGLVPGRRPVDSFPDNSDGPMMFSCRPASEQGERSGRSRRLQALLNRQLNARSASPRLIKTLPSPETSALLFAHHRSMSHSATEGYVPPPEVLRAALSATPSRRRLVSMPFPPGYRPSPDDPTASHALAYDSTTDADLDEAADECVGNGAGALSFWKILQFAM